MYQLHFSGLLAAFLLCNLNVSSQSFTSGPALGVHAIESGLWAVFDNPACLTDVQRFETGAFYKSEFLLSELAEEGFAFAVSAGKQTVISAGFRRRGYELFRHDHIPLAVARRFGNKVSAGVSVDYLTTAFGNDYGKSSVITATAGLRFSLTENLDAGLVIFNPQRSRLNSSQITRYPAVIRCGAAWKFGTYARLSAGIVKPDNDKTVWESAIDYSVNKKFRLRAGFSNGTTPVFFGYQFRLNKLMIQMSSGYHFRLGFSPVFLFVYQK